MKKMSCMSRVAALIIATSAAAFGTEAVFAAEDGSPQTQSSSSQPATAAPQRVERPRLPRLFSAEENQQFRERMKNAKTPEERAALRQKIRSAYEQRAKDRGINLPQHAERAPGGQHDQAIRSNGPIARLLTPEEQTQYRDRLKNAKDRTERMQVGRELHALVTQRAKEKGYTLPEREGRGPRHGHGPDDAAVPPRVQS